MQAGWVARAGGGGRPAKAARPGATPSASAYADGEGDPCPNCGRVYAVGEFWIACDFCDTWYDGGCVGMTPGRAQRAGQWKCPKCEEGGR